jgi:FkbM family methyltransferase
VAYNYRSVQLEEQQAYVREKKSIMQIANRSISRIIRAPFGHRHWIAAANMFRVYEQPFDAAKRYLLASGSYPHTFHLRTPGGRVSATAWSGHDVLTINEIFCRMDYGLDPRARIVVDFGSNIGLSALYFLTHALSSFVYCFEPLALNCERLNQTLANYPDRYCLSATAIATSAGKASFGCEPTGRYGGVGRAYPEKIEVNCLCAREVIAGLLGTHGKIDILKIDIEGLEEEVLLSLTTNQLEQIENIFVEADFNLNPLAKTHTMQKYGSVMQFRRLQ